MSSYLMLVNTARNLLRNELNNEELAIMFDGLSLEEENVVGQKESLNALGNEVSALCAKIENSSFSTNPQSMAVIKLLQLAWLSFKGIPGDEPALDGPTIESGHSFSLLQNINKLVLLGLNAFKKLPPDIHAPNNQIMKVYDDEIKPQIEIQSAVLNNKDNALLLNFTLQVKKFALTNHLAAIKWYAAQSMKEVIRLRTIVSSRDAEIKLLTTGKIKLFANTAVPVGNDTTASKPNLLRRGSFQ